ncbi:hypothetical protein CY34DRAFT_808033, partial [Suillus luteus UH-Slu-Lm8-n1]
MNPSSFIVQSKGFRPLEKILARTSPRPGVLDLLGANHEILFNTRKLQSAL